MATVQSSQAAIDHPAQTGMPPHETGHPRGLALLFGVEMWERFSYYGMRAILVLYLLALGMSNQRASDTYYGTYTSLVYLTPLLGGYLADRLIGTRSSLLIGGILIAAGHFCLAFGPEPLPGGGMGHGTMTMFIIGLALIIIGTGFFKPNVSTMVGQLYREGDPRRDAGFTIFYMGINLGALLGSLVCPWLAASPRFGWHYGFAAAGVGMVLGLIMYVVGRAKYLPGVGYAPSRTARPDPELAAAGAATVSPLIGGLGGLVGAALGYVSGGWLALAMGAIIGWALATSLFGTHGEERKRVIALFIVVFFVIFFWAAYEQAGSSMTVFAEKNTNRLVGSFEIPAGWFQSINPAVILIFAPIFAWLWVKLSARGKEPSTALKMVLGLFLLGLGFVFMVIGAANAAQGALVSPLWLTAAYVFHTWGELCLSPVGLSYVTKVAPVKFASLLMGVWFLANSAANKVAGHLAGMLDIWGATKLYTILVVSSLAAAVVMLVLVPLLKRLTSSVKA